MPRMAATEVVLLLLCGCGPVVAVDGASGSESMSTAPQETSSGGETLPSSTSTSIDPSTAVVDTGIEDSSGSDESGVGTGPDLPPLPEGCPGDVLVGDVLRPEEVYIAGTLSEGACWLDALAHWSSPNDAVAGFDCDFDNDAATIRPSDGRLLYTNFAEGRLREFHCDTCPIDDTSTYPNDPLANDDVLPTPGCGPAAIPLQRFLVDPDGTYLYMCGEMVWRDTDGAAVYDESSGALLHLGYDDLGLTELGVVRLSTGVSAPMDLPIDDMVLTLRADPRDGFFIVREDGGTHLWHVGSDGSTTAVGEYPPAPEGYQPLYPAALDGCGALFQQGWSSGTDDVILRRGLDGSADVVYSESYDPQVRLHISGLVTGP